MANPRGTTTVALAIVVLLIAALIVAAEPVHGSVLLTVMPGHGVDTGDLIVLPLLILAAWLVRTGSHTVGPNDRSDRARRAGSAIGFGASLAVVGGLRLADVTQRAGPTASVLALLLGCTAIWFAAEMVLGAGSLVEGVAGRGWILGGVLLVGCLIDVMFVPSGTVFGVAALALCLAVFVRLRWLAVAMVVLAVSFILFNVASLADIARVDEVMSGDGGAAARATALGLVLMSIGVVSYVSEVQRA